LAEGKALIDKFEGIMDAPVYSAYHQASALFHKVRAPRFVAAALMQRLVLIWCSARLQAKKNAQEFFNHSILYLTYTPLSSIPLQQQISLASAVGNFPVRLRCVFESLTPVSFVVGEAALLGENTYNFGELVSRALALHSGSPDPPQACFVVLSSFQLQHPIIKVLNGTQYEWLANLLFAFNAGDLAKFNAILKQEGKQVCCRWRISLSSPFCPAHGSPMCCCDGRRCCPTSPT
jgi:hypothetical protein